MKNPILPSLLLVTIWMFSCSQPSRTGESDTSALVEADTLQDVSQLTYEDVVAMIYDDAGERIEWHGEEMPNDLTNFLSISAGDPCGEGGCGQRLSLTSTADQSMTVIIRGDYDLEGDQGYIPRKYVIGAGETLLIGCSHLCIGGKAYAFPRTIVGSSYVKTE